MLRGLIFSGFGFTVRFGGPFDSLSFDQILTKQVVHFQVRVHTLDNILPFYRAFCA